MDFHSLAVKHIKHETADTITIEFEVPETLQKTFDFIQGQYLTVRREINGEEVRRSYSMSSSPLEGRLAVTVKKVPGGRMSGLLHDSLKEGDTLEVAPPEGRFYCKTKEDERRMFYLFGAGSGITPLISIIKTTLEKEPMSSIKLLYGSKDTDNIIFREELDQLAQRYDGQLEVEYVLSQVKKEGGLFGRFKKGGDNWQGKKGRIDDRMVKNFLQEHPPASADTECHYFVCGPGNMAETVMGYLEKKGIDSKHIHAELFLNASQSPPGANIGKTTGEGTQLIAHLKGERIELTIPKGATVLDTLIKNKHDAPYSCTSGACATCMGKVIQGEVKMDVCYALDEDEIKDGYCLTCQSRPQTDVLEISYDV